ncbi:MAG: hypothetical protein JWP04_1772 [Belnapia sp.]|nr:hypothetical protein [Belnapia sp.]
MASIETIRPIGAGASTQSAEPPAAVPAAFASPAAFQGGPGDDRLTGLLAFAMAAERQADGSPETIARLKQEAEKALTEHAFRILHNNIETLRRDAVVEHLGHLPRPPGLLRLISANLVALALAGAAGGWLALHPQTLAGLTGLLAG